MGDCLGHQCVGFADDRVMHRPRARGLGGDGALQCGEVVEAQHPVGAVLFGLLLHIQA
ncbi:hypothetical protein D3C74_306060 [compost metagenome]